jgi:YVTN family beta-propeller protein
VPVGLSPVGVATDPTRAHVFVGNDADGTVSVIDAARNVVVATVGVGSHPLAFGAFVAAPSAAASCDSQNEGAADDRRHHKRNKNNDENCDEETGDHEDND